MSPSYHPYVTRLQERIFPRLLGEATEHFAPASCSYRVLRSKDTTGRVVVWKQLNVPHSFTLEASYISLYLPVSPYDVPHAFTLEAAFCPPT